MMKSSAALLLLVVSFFCSAELINAQQTGGKKPVINVIAYYSGNQLQIDKYDVKKLTHIIYSFCHLKGNRLNVDNAADTITIQKLAGLKKINPTLKVMLSLGGWGGCKPCSDVFDADERRKEFASSVKQLNDYFHTDGIDLDWEYPTIEGHPGHPYKKEDKQNFTALVRSLRDTLGATNEISFAAGGFPEFLEQSVEWDKLASLIDRVNLMSYDLVNGFSTTTGHHTPLYSTAQQKASADQAIRYFETIRFPLNKVVIGAAFYARTWENVPEQNNGLYQSGKFKSFVSYDRFTANITIEKGYSFYFDEQAKAPYAYNAATKTYATFDNAQSLRLKTEYAISKKLNGIMFWEMTLDKSAEGLLDVIDKAVKK